MIKKFKIWNKKEKKLHGPFSLSDIRAYDGESQVIFFANSSGDFCDIGNNLGYSQDDTEEMQKNLEFLQFTGLLDKNGREIYEGDILNLHYDGEMDYISKVLINFDGCAMIENDSHSNFRALRNFTFKEDYLVSAGYACCEVIGNIHQNPELLS